MAGTGFDLDRLLSPVEVGAFLHETWGKRPCVIRRGEPGYYAGLFSRADLDHVIAFSRPRFTETAAFRGGSPAAKSYVLGWLPDQQPAPSDVCPGIGDLRRVYAEGKTIIIRAMQHRWPAVASLCRNLEALFHCPVHVNLYLTPPGAQGFDAHFDGHEVFALQIDGVKHWQLYGPAAELPLAEDKSTLLRSRLGPAQEVRLEAGDLLYIPRGHAHEAATGARSSLHLTVGVNVYRWADLLQQALVGATRRDPRFRETLPPGVLVGSPVPAVGSPMPAQVGERFGELLRALADAACVEDAARRLGDRFFDGLAMLPGAHFATPEGVEELELDTILARDPGVLCRVLVDGTGAVVEFPGARVAGPVKVAAALQFIARSERFSVRALPELGDDAKLVLARRLVREGLLTIVGAPPTAALPASANGAAEPQLEPAAPEAGRGPWLA
jgi:hypothetical protein